MKEEDNIVTSLHIILRSFLLRRLKADGTLYIFKTHYAHYHFSEALTFKKERISFVRTFTRVSHYLH